MKNVSELSGDELLDELGVETEVPQTGGYTAREERLLAGFEDILRFRETHGRTPQHGEEKDIFERIYAVRLDRLRKLMHKDLAVLANMDRHSMLTNNPTKEPDDLDAEALLSELGMGPAGQNDISVLRHVSSLDARRNSPDQVADRIRCEEFAIFKPLFDEVQADLQNGLRVTRQFAQNEAAGATIELGDFFILQGQLVYVAGIGEAHRTPNGETDGRLRVIYSNGTESNLLLRSLQSALYGKGEKKERGFRVTQVDLGPLFGNSIDGGDIGTGTIYVLNSLSEEPKIVAMGNVLHKIGVTGSHVEDRIANAEQDATYLLAPVKVVATWTLANVHRFRLEQTLHRVFAAAQVQLTVNDRFGNPVQPREWFLVPLPVIDEAVCRIRDCSITEFTYNPQVAALVSAT